MKSKIKRSKKVRKKRSLDQKALLEIHGGDRKRGRSSRAKVD